MNYRLSKTIITTKKNYFVKKKKKLMAVEPKELKIVLVGHTNVGKTCIVRQATTGVFSEDSAPTLGASYVSKLTNVNGTDVRLQIWDTAGQERYKGMTPMYYRGAQTALIVYSVTDSESFDSVDSWLTSLRENAEPNIILFLLANKCDMESERVITTEQGQEKAKQMDAHFYEVSAKTGNGIEEVFSDIPRYFLESQSPSPIEQQTGLKLDGNTETKKPKTCC